MPIEIMVECPYCGGTGVDPEYPGEVVCPVCGGAGDIPEEEEEA